jgi:peptidoglycan/xylan/chitin deacetylase (PgdA/CDA1 family)
MATGISRPRQVVKSALAGGLYYSGLLHGCQLLRRTLGGPRVHALTYHRIVPDYAAVAGRVIPALCTSTTTFEAELTYLAQIMDVLDLASALDVLHGHRPVRRDVCVLTFDDGYRDTYTQALPILARMGLPATVFVPTGYVGSPEPLLHDRLYAVLRVAAATPQKSAADTECWVARARAQGAARAVECAVAALQHDTLSQVTEALEHSYGHGDGPDDDGLVLDWSQCQKLADAGVEIGSHTVSHRRLAGESEAAIRRELRDSKADIELHVGRPVRFLAYPNGAYSPVVVHASRDLGYLAAFTSNDHPNRIGAEPLELGRKLLWEAHASGVGKRPSRALLASHLLNLHGEWRDGPTARAR